MYWSGTDGENRKEEDIKTSYAQFDRKDFVWSSGVPENIHETSRAGTFRQSVKVSNLSNIEKKTKQKKTNKKGY